MRRIMRIIVRNDKYHPLLVNVFNERSVREDTIYTLLEKAIEILSKILGDFSDVETFTMYIDNTIRGYRDDVTETNIDIYCHEVDYVTPSPSNPELHTEIPGPLVRFLRSVENKTKAIINIYLVCPVSLSNSENDCGKIVLLRIYLHELYHVYILMRRLLACRNRIYGCGDNYLQQVEEALAECIAWKGLYALYPKDLVDSCLSKSLYTGSLNDSIFRKCLLNNDRLISFD